MKYLALIGFIVCIGVTVILVLATWRVMRGRDRLSLAQKEIKIKENVQAVLRNTQTGQKTIIKNKGGTKK